MRPSSSSTTEPRIDGFRIVRETARRGTAVTYDAIQLDLQRPVSLTLLAPGDPRAERFRADAWPEHPRVVSLYAAGPSERGFFIATRRVDSATTLRRRVAAGADPSSWLADVRATLTVTGAIHGALDDEWSLLVDRDGRVLITGFGLGAPEATGADDTRALARLARTAASARRSGRRRRALAVVVVAAVGAALLLAAAASDDGARRAGVEPPVQGAVPLGSALAAGPLRTVDCDGEAPSGGSFSCTAMQMLLPRRPLVVARAGVVVAWHVRGARGRVALRVIQRRGTKTFAAVGGSDFEPVDEGLRSFRAAVPVCRGDRFALELAPGSAAGFRAAVPGATTTRFIDELDYESRAPNAAGAGRDEELLLRVDYVPGKAVEQPKRLVGTAAAGARAGRRLDEREIVTADGDTATVAVVALDDGVAVDLFGGSRRRARIAVPGADPRGRPAAFTAKGEADLTLAWRNQDGTPIQTRYRVTASGIAAVR